MSSNSMSYLIAARAIFNGDIKDANEAMKEHREARSGALFKALCNLICHAQIVVFPNGYDKKGARKFMEDVAAECGLSEKQAFKYTSAITAALGLRGTRSSFKATGIDGLPVAANDGPEAVVKQLKLFEIETFNQFIAHLRKAVSPVTKVAEALAKLNQEQQAEAVALAKRLSKSPTDQKKAA